jgi:hypothetical protein
MGILALYVADNKFKVGGDRALQFRPGRRVKAWQGGEEVFFTVESSEYGAGTVVTVRESTVAPDLQEVLFSVLAAGERGGLPLHSHSGDSQGGAAMQPKAVGFTGEYNNGVLTEATVIDWANGNNQVITLGAAEVGLTFANMTVGHKQLRVLQDETGGRVPVLPAGKWHDGADNEFSTDPDSEDILSIYCNGPALYYMLSKGWALP